MFPHANEMLAHAPPLSCFNSSPPKTIELSKKQALQPNTNDRPTRYNADLLKNVT